MGAARRHTPISRSVAFDYERMRREAKAANTDLDAAHVIAEHLALNPGARINWEQFLKSYR
jgi:hypothetical protein